MCGTGIILFIIMDRYIVFLDIDGTVYCHGQIVPRNRVAIRKAQAAGHKILINTARSLADIPPKILDADWDGIVAGIGCTVLVEGKKLRSVRIPVTQVAQVFDEMTSLHIPLMLEGEDVLLCNTFYPDADHAVLLQSGNDILCRYKDRVLAKAFIPAVLPQDVQNSLSARFQFYQHRNYAEFSVRGHNKATGMQCVLDFYGADRAHCIAMGDSINDLDMLRYAGVSVAMGDAGEDVKKICSLVTCNADEGGVAEALETLLKL